MASMAVLVGWHFPQDGPAWHMFVHSPPTVMVGHPVVKHHVRFPMPWSGSDEGRDVI